MPIQLLSPETLECIQTAQEIALFAGQLGGSMALAAAVGIRETAASAIRYYFDIAADLLHLHPEMRYLLSVPFRESKVELPLRRDDQRLQLFRGYRVQHNGVRGPTLGPLRAESTLDVATLRAVAESMTWRCAAANVPFGGAAGGLACDPAQLSSREYERLIRRYTARLHHVFGIYQDVCIPGENAGPDAMSWIASEYSSLNSGAAPVSLGARKEADGAASSSEAVGAAIAALILRAASDLNLPISGLRVAIQSLDQSGISIAASLVNAGCVVVALAEERGAISSPAGLDMRAINREVSRHGRFGDGHIVDVVGADCDVLAISAPECALHPSATGRIRAAMVVETSELLVTPTAEQALAGRGVLVIPDLVAAAGTVLAANVEWSNHVNKEKCKPELMQREVETGMLRTYDQVCDRSRKENVSLRTAAYCLAIERIARTERLRVA